MAIWAHEDPVLVYLTIEGETVVTTPEHPFYTVEGAWVPAADLQPGAEIRTAAWGSGTVEKVEFSLRPQVMYNFTVAEAHTYFVGDKQWLVHNHCIKFNLPQVQSKYKHASDFGVTGNWNTANGVKFQEALANHVHGVNTQIIQGTYRGQNVLHYFDSTTNLNVIADLNGNFISGWKLNPTQVHNITTTGSLGGG